MGQRTKGDREEKQKRSQRKKKKKRERDEGATVSTPASWLFQLHSHLFAEGLSRPPCVCSGRLIAFPSSFLSY